MEFNKELRPKAAFGAFIVNDKNQIFCMKRSGSHGADTWNPPGGHIEYGESFLEAVKREVKEESDLDIDGIEFLGVTNDIFEEEKKHSVTLFFKVTGYSGQPKIMEPDRCTQVGWFDLNDLPKPLFLPDRHFFGSNPLCLCGSGKKFKECHGTDFK